MPNTRRILENGFNEATSVNIPKVDLEMILIFLFENKDYYSSEFRHGKTMQ